MKEIIFIEHAEKRRKQRGYIPFEIECIIERPMTKRKRPDGRTEISGRINNKHIKIVYEEKENYLKVVTII